MTKVLVIDDDQFIAKFVKLSIETARACQVMMAYTGAEGIEAAQTFKPDIIFLDIMLPDIQGGEVAERIREIPECSETPIIFLTGILTQEEAQKSRGTVGGKEFLAKPVTRDQLVECIDRRVPKK